MTQTPLITRVSGQRLVRLWLNVGLHAPFIFCENGKTEHRDIVCLHPAAETDATSVESAIRPAQIKINSSSLQSFRSLEKSLARTCERSERARPRANSRGEREMGGRGDFDLF